MNEMNKLTESSLMTKTLGLLLLRLVLLNQGYTSKSMKTHVRFALLLVSQSRHYQYLGMDNSFLSETVMCIAQPLLNRCSQHPFNHNNQKCFQKLTNIIWGTQSSPVKNHCQKSTTLVLCPRTINQHSSEGWLCKPHTKWLDISELAPCITYFVLWQTFFHSWDLSSLWPYSSIVE